MRQLATHSIAVICLVLLWSGDACAQRTAEEQVKTLRVPEGFDVSLFASEPLITNPSAIDIDTHGRVWVAEIQWYRSRAKQPPADKIKVLEDTDGDGRADKVTVFAEGVFAPMSICVAGDKVYVATSPDLWVYEDKNGDLKADGPPKKLLTGFGGFNHDHGAHSLVLGPDHKWWMAHGDTGFNVTGTDGSRIEYKWGAMLRGELDGSKLETVAVNFRNPYELCVSSFGESYFSDNDNDGNESVRAGWVLEGGNYGWFGSPPGPRGQVPPEIPFSQHWHFRGHIPGYVPATLVTGFGSPCGICFYEGDAFGPKYKNAPLHCDAGPREVRIYRHELDGYGMKATTENIMTTDGDNYFRPDDICAAPDGSLYVSDWYDGGVGGHAYNDPDRGRIFRLTPKGKKLQRPGKPGPYSNTADAIAALRSPNLATQFLAREWLLGGDSERMAALDNVLSNDADPNMRARALWLLDRIGGSARNRVVEQLQSKDASFRALAVRILRRHADDGIRKLLPLAADPSLEVRREVLLAMPALSRVDSQAAWSVLVKLAATYDGRDRYQLEAINVAAGERKGDLYAELDRAGVWSSEKLALMGVLNPQAAGEFLAKKLDRAGADDAEGMALLHSAAIASSREAMKGVLALASNTATIPALRNKAIGTIDFALTSAWKPFAGDTQLVETLRNMLADPQLEGELLELAGKHGIAALGPDALRIATSEGRPIAARQRAIAVTARLKPPGFSEALSALLADTNADVRDLALKVLVDMQDIKTIRAILSAGDYSPAVQKQTVERLMAGTGGALVLWRMLEAKSLAPSLEKSVVAIAVEHPDSNVRTLYEKYVPASERPKKLGEAIQPDQILSLTGNPKRGEQIFFQSTAAQCKSCHTVRGQGSSVGPDLSLIGKKYERATLLDTILNPSKAIAPEYYTYVVETNRGQVFAGFLAEKSDKTVVLKDAKGEMIRIAARDVVDLLKTEKSMMPDLVLRDVPAQDAADLLAYLTTLK
jgi:putative membrane-bound dehydrogenase-like protein